MSHVVFDHILLFCSYLFTLIVDFCVFCMFSDSEDFVPVKVIGAVTDKWAGEDAEDAVKVFFFLFVSRFVIYLFKDHI